MWVIANFLEENNVEVVPYIWIQNDECWWPVVPNDKLKKYIEREVPHDQNSEIWKKYKARVIGKPYSNLQKARQKSNDALIRSDLETDDNQKRKIKKSRRYAFFDDSSDDSDSSEQPSTPKKRRPNSKKNLWPLSNQKESPLKEPPHMPRRSPRKNQSPSGSFLTPAREIDSPFQSSSKTETTNFEKISIRNQNTIKSYLRTILEEISSIKAQIECLKSGMNKEDDFEKSDFLNKLPVKTIDELTSLEQDLLEKTKENELISFLKKLGGSNIGDCCRRILRASMTDEMASQYSWAGRKGKRVFSTLNLKTAIFRAVLSQFQTATQKELEETVMNWLRPSKNRLLSKEKSRKRTLEEDEDNTDL